MCVDRVFNDIIEHTHGAGFETGTTHIVAQVRKNFCSKIYICDWENEETKYWIILAQKSFFWMYKMRCFGKGHKKSVLALESVCLHSSQLFYTLKKQKKRASQHRFNVCKGVAKSNFNS